MSLVLLYCIAQLCDSSHKCYEHTAWCYCHLSADIVSWVIAVRIFFWC